MKTTSSTTLRAAIAILSSLIIVIRGVFDDPATLAAARNTPRAFTRAYKLPFGTMLRIAFTNIRKNGTNLLNTFFNDILRNELPLEERTLIEDEILKGDVDRMPPTQQAYSKARAKMNHLPFKMAFESCIRFLYGEDQRSNLATAGGTMSSPSMALSSPCLTCRSWLNCMAPPAEPTTHRLHE